MRFTRQVYLFFVSSLTKQRQIHWALPSCCTFQFVIVNFWDWLLEILVYRGLPFSFQTNRLPRHGGQLFRSGRSAAYLQCDISGGDRHDHPDDDGPTGKRTEGKTYSGYAFTYKLSMAAGGELGGFLLAASGYVPPVVQIPTADHTIRALFTLALAISGIFAFILMYFYQLDKNLFEQILKDLDERRGPVTRGTNP
jgi:hypothetical protein